jgi:CheY-like chemotaxis protein
MLLGDANRIGQVIGNFLSNAVKFTERGAIHVAIAAHPIGPQEFDLRISVQDTGAGIDPEMQTRLFQKFVQAETGSGRHGGTGLGLAISKELAALMGGEVGVDSAPGGASGGAPGGGSIFWLRLRARAVETATAESAAPGKASLLESPGERRIKVLVAEDNEINQRVVGAMLELGGHHYVVAKDGAEALAIVQQAKFDAVLMDAQMPNMDGPSAAQAIRALGGDYATLPIIALTANALAGDKERYIAAGMNHYIAKPFTPDELTLALRTAVASDVAPIRGIHNRKPAQEQD